MIQLEHFYTWLRRDEASVLYTYAYFPSAESVGCVTRVRSKYTALWLASQRAIKNKHNIASSVQASEEYEWMNSFKMTVCTVGPMSH